MGGCVLRSGLQPQAPDLLLQGRSVCLLLGQGREQESGRPAPFLGRPCDPPTSPSPPCHLLQVLLQLPEHGLQVRDLL